jgi:ketosteroid isomerase-like protein
VNESEWRRFWNESFDRLDDELRERSRPAGHARRLNVASQNKASLNVPSNSKRAGQVDEIIRRYIAAYQSDDRKTAEGILSDSFTFTSPLDDHIDKAAYFARCWPNNANLVSFEIEKLIEGDNEAFVRYQLESKSGIKFRNTEYFKIKRDQIEAVEVYFGPDTRAPAESQIRKLIEDRAQALRGKNAAAFLANCSPDTVTFLLAPPLRNAVTLEEARSGLEAWFATFKGPIGYEERDLNLTVSNEVAFCHSLNHISGARTSGEMTSVWVRTTICLRKINGVWLISHEHQSVPFYMDGSYKAAVDLKPV